MGNSQTQTPWHGMKNDINGPAPITAIYLHHSERPRSFTRRLIGLNWHVLF